MRNNNRSLPHRISLSKDKREMARFASKRPDGSIKDHPQERMRAGGEHRDDTLH
ncbi:MULTISPECIES: small acid-soluble spore protein K [Salipaludibacillus]|uniref:Small, acid-soluble spore protein K n=1 Tax=Salipaludibacillus aurantiacus TaxID=1601833 RepID=A0A1H9SNQ6_9BACI|nr:small acid-soluble spore protein K [Salipaludibacillus aurantiacus]SER86013.1 small acid-soluble spore protein K (minor) [Salipaludibacillus aurantiacus]